MSRDDGSAASRPVDCRRTGLRAWLPTVICTAVILITATRPLPWVLRGKHVDKLLHGITYFLLALMAYRSFAGSGSRHPTVYAVLLALAVGCSDEAIQAMGRARAADRYDLIADAAGALVAAVIMRLRLLTGHGSVDNSLSR